jgi:nicotinate phosphoribosyltransferase
VIWTCAHAPILSSLLDIDFYKLTMGQFILKYFPLQEVCFGFTNRTVTVPLARVIRESDLRRELDHARTLRFSEAELSYLRGLQRTNQRFFSDEYLAFLKDFQLPAYELTYRGDSIELTFAGRWSRVTYWEIAALSIINELYFRTLMRELIPSQQEDRYAHARSQLREKLKALARRPRLTFSDFGTRRRFSAQWQKEVVALVRDEALPGQFVGTSNTLLAMHYGIPPTGTNAHELPMVFAGLHQETDAELSQAPQALLELWWGEYGEDLSIILPDTFGSDHLFRTLGSEVARRWKGFRQDSGDPIEFGEKEISFYERHQVDPRSKLVVFSDGLTVPTMLALDEHFDGRIHTTFGWGTNLTNDVGFKPLSIVIKAVEAEGQPLVKLSDNIQKAIGPAGEIARYKRVFGYDTLYSEAPVY